MADDDFEELIEVHERDFQNFSVENSIYLIPVDEEEEDRLVLQASLLYEIFGQRLFLPPLEYPRYILDCGYGRGTWAVSMAQTYVYSEVTAIDIYPAEFPEEPDNLTLEIFNLNDRLMPTYRRNQYDLIHSRCISPGIKRSRWRSYVRELAQLLKPQGWIQLAEYYYNIQSHSGRLTEDHALYKWGKLYRKALEDDDRNPRIYRDFTVLLRDAGLTDIQTQLYQIPIGNWPSNPREQTIGTRFVQVMDEMLNSHAIYLFTQRLNLPVDQVNALVAQAQQEMRDPSLRPICRYVAYARRR